jgi:hypothetical protein
VGSRAYCSGAGSGGPGNSENVAKSAKASKRPRGSVKRLLALASPEKGRIGCMCRSAISPLNAGEIGMRKGQLRQ